MFIHNPVLKARLLLGGLAVMSLWLAWILVPRREAAHAAQWLASLAFVGLAGTCVYLCKAVGALRMPALPDPAQWRGPNQVALGKQLAHVGFTVVMLAYSSYSLVVDDFYLPGKRGPGIHLHGLAAWLMSAAALCACIHLMSAVVDHYDRRNNERLYAHAAALAQWFGWTFFLSALMRHYLAR